MQIELRRSCETILLKDLQEISSRLIRTQNRGIFVDLQQIEELPDSSGYKGSGKICRVCRQPLLSHSFNSTDPQATNSGGKTSSINAGGFHQPALVVFRCSHVFHQACIQQTRRFAACPVCVQERTAVP